MLGLFCACAFLLSMSFSYTSGGQYYDFRMLPFVLGILYGGYLIGTILVVLYVGGHFLFFSGELVWELPLDVGLYLLPLAFAFVLKFQRSTPRMKMYIASNFIMSGLAVSMLIYMIKIGSGIIRTDLYTICFMAMYSLIYMFTAYLVVYFFESILEKLSLQQRLQDMSNQYLQEARKMKQLIDATPLGVISVDRNGYLTDLNEMMLRLFNLVGSVKSEELLGEHYEIALSKYDLPYPSIQIARSLKGENTGAEIMNVGDKIFVTTSYSIWSHESDEVVGAVGMAHDVTELQTLRSEIGNMERLSLVGQMAASITHEIRNPMAVVRGFVQLMKEKSEQSLHEYYRIVLEELDRANAIINDFLSLAQNRIVEKEESHLHDIINDLSPLLWADANLRGQSIEMNLDEHVPQLHLNPKEIKQLILNLVRNGMEAMKGKGVLTLETKLIDGTVQLIVSDIGDGIPKDKLDKLFEPFYTTKTKGTGLGLPLCLSIVERHQGKITVESVEGQGTSIIVSFKANARIGPGYEDQKIS